jgi:hypothetical protein
VPTRLLSAAVCALGAHALVYATLRPGDGLHGYLGWYELVLALASVVALLVVRPTRLLTRRPVEETARRIAVGALLVLLAQESLERSVEAGRPTFVALTPSQWLLLLFAVAATALLLAFALRAGQAVVARLVRRDAVRPRAAATWSIVTVSPRPARPLAERFALRAPPAAA